MRGLVDRIVGDDYKNVKHPYTGESTPIHVSEIGDMMLEALDIAKNIAPLPVDSELVISRGTFTNSLSFTDLQILEGKLKTSCSVRVEGDALPKQLIITRGLSECRFKWSTLEELTAINDELLQRISEVSDKNSPNHIPDPAKQAFAAQVYTEAQKKTLCEMDALHKAIKAREDGKKKDKDIMIEYKSDTEKCRNPDFRAGENDGFRNGDKIIK